MFEYLLKKYWRSYMDNKKIAAGIFVREYPQPRKFLRWCKKYINENATVLFVVIGVLTLVVTAF